MAVAWELCRGSAWGGVRVGARAAFGFGVAVTAPLRKVSWGWTRYCGGRGRGVDLSHTGSGWACGGWARAEAVLGGR